MSKPFEIVAAPFTVYVAPLGTAFPLLGVAPAGAWIKLGTSGDRSMSEEGVTVAHGQEINQIRTAGSTGPVKAFRTEESLVISLTLLDISLEQYALAFDGNTVATTAAGVGTAGHKALKLYRGVNVDAVALLVRGDVSAYGDGMQSQYEIPACFQSGSPEPVFTKGEPAGLALEYTALEDPDAATPDARFGRLLMQHALPLP
jgi:hypothetical protein